MPQRQLLALSLTLLVTVSLSLTIPQSRPPCFAPRRGPLRAYHRADTQGPATERVASTTTETLSKLTVEKLKEKCRATGLPVAGRKAELVERLAQDADQRCEGSQDASHMREPTTKDTLMLFKIPRDTSEDAIRNFFAEICASNTGEPIKSVFCLLKKGRAYVVFEDTNVATEVLSKGTKSEYSTDKVFRFQGKEIYAKMAQSSRLEKDMQRAALSEQKNARVILKEACDRRKSLGFDAELEFIPTATILRNVNNGRRLVKTIDNRGFASTDGQPDAGFVNSAFRVQCSVGKSVGGTVAASAEAEAESLKGAKEVAAARVLSMLVEANAVDHETIEDFESNNIRKVVISEGDDYDRKIARLVSERGETILVAKAPRDASTSNVQKEFETNANRDLGFLEDFEQMDAVLTDRLAQARRAIASIREGGKAHKELLASAEGTDDNSDENWSSISSLDRLAAQLSAHFTLAFTLLKRRFEGTQDCSGVALRWVRDLVALGLPPPFPTTDIITSSLKLLSSVGSHEAIVDILSIIDHKDATYINYLATAYMVAKKPHRAVQLVFKGGMMETFGIKPNAMHVNALLTRGKLSFKVTQEAIETDLPRLGITPTTSILNSYMKATLFHKSDDPDQVVRIFRSIHQSGRLQVSSGSWDAYISALVLKGDLESALQVVDQEMPAESLKIGHINTLIEGFGQHSQPKEAYSLFLDIPRKYGLHYDTHSFSSAINAVSFEGGNIDTAEKIFDLLNSTAPPNAAMTAIGLRGKPPPDKRWRPDQNSLGALMQAHVRANNTERVDEILGWMHSHGKGLDLSIFDRLLMVCAASGYWAKAVELVERELTAAPPFALAPGKLVDQKALNVALVACAKVGEKETGLRLFKLFEEKVGPGNMLPDPFSFNALLEAVVNSPTGTWKDGARLLKLMLKRGVQPEVYTLNAFLACCRKDGASDGACETALRVLSDMRKGLYKDIQPDEFTYNVAISSCRERGKWDAAKEILELMKRDGFRPNLITYNSLLAVGVKAPEVAREAIEVFETMESAGGITPDDVSLDCLLDILGANPGFEEEATRYYNRGTRAGLYRHFDDTRFLIDLHGCSQTRAGIVLRVILNNFRESTVVTGDASAGFSVQQTLIRDELVVVTGKGLRSKTDFVLGPAARKFLALNFSPPLELREIPGNAGRFAISKKSLLDWALAVNSAKANIAK